MVGAFTFVNLLAVRTVHPEAVEEVAKNGAQNGTDDRTGDEGCLGGAQVQHVGTECHTACLNENTEQVDQAEFDRFTLPVFGAGVAEGPQAVHEPREDGCDNTCNDLRLGVGLRHDGHHQHPHRHRVHDEGCAAHGTEFENLNTVAVPEGFQTFGEGRFRLCAHAGPI